jgi:hypothetical protein
LNNIDGCFQILDSSLKINFIEVEFPIQIIPQLLYFNNLLNTELIKSISVKNRKNNEFVVVWDESENNQESTEHLVTLNLVTFTTNHVRFILENGDISPFLPPFSIELQGLYAPNNVSVSSEYFNALLNDTKFSDMEFLVENRPIKAHKCIISMRCPYFNKILKNNSSNEPIIIENISFNSFKSFIKYLYTNDFNETFFTPDLLCELFSLSIEYDLLDLKKICLDAFYNLCADPNNIMDLYHKTVDYNIDELIDVCLKLLSFNFELILSMRKDNNF